MIKTNWYVITGAPSSGKTTLINHLAMNGFSVAPEIARSHIELLLANNYTLDEIQRNNKPLQRAILASALKRERKLHAAELIFFDRGTTDSLGYFNYYHLETKNLIQVCQRFRYKKIFYCHQLPLISDEVRVEDTLGAQKIGESIFQAYIKMNYELIELPAVSVEDRSQIVLSHLDKNPPAD
ncbi:MAG: ATP-binding protein [bacterium]|nr:ATP-binding protein [bacterium]